MERRLQKSINHVKGLHNLITIALILPFTLLFVFFAEFSIGDIYAEIDQESNGTVDSIIFGASNLNNSKTFPPRVITLVQNNEPRKELVYGVNSSDIIKELEIELDDNDLVIPADDSALAEGSILRVIDVVVKVTMKTEEIPFVQQEMKTDSLTTGTIKLEQAGENGLREKTIHVLYYDGEVVKSEVKGVSIVKDPVSEITLIGTKPVTIASCEHWAKYVDRVTKDERERNWMKKVMFWESGCDSGRLSHGTGFYKGLFQFSPKTFRDKGGEEIFDGAEQIRIVHKMYQSADDNYLSLQWPRSNGVFINTYGPKN